MTPTGLDTMPPNAQRIGTFRSIEAVDPTTIAVLPDRVVVAGGGRSGQRTVGLEDIERVKLRTLLGVTTVLIRTRAEGTIVADLFAREEAEAVRDLLDEVRSAPAATRRSEAPAA